MELILTLLVGMIVVAVVFAFVTAAVGRWLGALVLEVSLFFAPRLFSFRLGRVSVRVGLLPLGSSVRFWDLEIDPEEDPPAPQDLSRQTLFENLPLVRRLAIRVSGWAAVVFLAALVLGPAEALRELGEGFRDLFLFLLRPGFAQQALASFDALAQASPWEAGALWMVKLTAINLLPLPFYAGGQILIEVLSSVLRRPVRPPDSLMFVFLLLGLGITYIAGKELWVYLAR